MPNVRVDGYPRPVRVCHTCRNAWEEEEEEPTGIREPRVRHNETSEAPEVPTAHEIDLRARMRAQLIRQRERIPPVTPESVNSDLAAAFDAYEKHRILLAARIVARIRRAVRNFSATDRDMAAGKLETHHALIEKIRARARVRREALSDFGHEDELSDDEDGTECERGQDGSENIQHVWTPSRSWGAVRTFFRVDDKDGTMWVRMVGILDRVHALYTLAVLRETDLFRLWVPFCSQSERVAMLGRAEMITWWHASMPFLVRDAVLHAYGVDVTREHAGVLMIGQSAEPRDWPEVAFPREKGWFTRRMDIKALRGLIEPLERDRARMTLVINVDVKAPVPMPIVNFLMKKIVGIFLTSLRRAAVEADAAARFGHHNAFLERVEKDPAFYRDWAAVQLEEFFKTREKLDAQT